MKKSTLSLAFIALLLAVIITGCAKKGSSDDPVTPTGKLTLKGQVVNAVTNEPLAGVRVDVTGLAVLTTDASGNYSYQLGETHAGEYYIRARATGFGYGSTVAFVTANQASAGTIALTPLAAPVTVTPQGGAVSVPDPEAWKAGSDAVLKIPANALETATGISLTRFTGNAVPSYAPESLLNMGAFHLAPASLVLKAALSMEIPLPVQQIKAASMPLLKYSEESDTWISTGVNATVDAARGLAVVPISEPGTYSLGIDGSYSEGSGTPGTQEIVKVDPKQSSVMMSYQAAYQPENNAPSGYSAAWLTNLASQNTYTYGIKTSFSDLTWVTVNYIGTKPDSIPTTKATLAGFYRWVPQVGRNAEYIPSATVVEGMLINGLVTKEQETDRGIWQFIHDQGGGGK